MQTKTGRRQMLVVLFSLCLATPCGFVPPTASALPVAVSEATLDWSGLTFAFSGPPPTVTGISEGGYFSSSFASTSFGNELTHSKFSFLNPTDWAYTAAVLADANSKGYVNTQASATNGLLQSRSEAATTSSSWSVHDGAAGAMTHMAFWPQGSGFPGMITVSVPYTLEIELSETQPRSTDPHDVTAASASVVLALGPGAGWYASETLSWPDTNPPLNGTLTKEGILTLSAPFGIDLLVSIYASVETKAMASVVPEPSTLLLLGSGLVGLGGVAWRRHRTSRDR